MKKRKGNRIRGALCLGLCALMLAGCTGAASSGTQAAPLDPLTGQEALYTGERPAAVTIENAAGNKTQWGIAEASVVLEALTKTGDDTSLCLVYPSLEAMPTVGPVTAGQDLYWRLLAGQQPLPVQRGGGVYNANYLSYYNITAVDALVVGRNAFSSDDSWSGVSLWRTSGTAARSVLSSLNISSALADSGKTVLRAVDSTTGEETLSVPPLLPFRTGGEDLPDADAEDAVSVNIRFDDTNATGFAYDAETSRYKMLHADGTAQLDANTGEQAAFDNLLLLYCAPSVRDDGRTLDYDLTVGGGVWLCGGRLWNITWRQGTDSTFAIYSANGEALNITPGRSYLALIASLTGQELAVTNTSGEKIAG